MLDFLAYYGLNSRRQVIVCNITDYALLLEDNERRRVGYTELKGGIARISTVFVGGAAWGCQKSDDGEALVFETLIEGIVQDGAMVRYSTWESADRGHRALVKAIESILEASSVQNGCKACRNYHGKVYGHALLVCAIHPYGYEGECPDFEAKLISRPLELKYPLPIIPGGHEEVRPLPVRPFLDEIPDRETMWQRLKRAFTLGLVRIPGLGEDADSE